jgi:hypothetical protein
MASPVVVVLPEADQQLGDFLEVSRSVGVEEPAECLVAALVFALDLQVSSAPGDSPAPVLARRGIDVLGFHIHRRMMKDTRKMSV